LGWYRRLVDLSIFFLIFGSNRAFSVFLQREGQHDIARLFFAAILFLWFDTANIILPFLAWPGQALIFPVLPIKFRAGYSIVFVPLITAATAWFIFRFLQQESAAERQRRHERN